MKTAFVVATLLSLAAPTATAQPLGFVGSELDQDAILERMTGRFPRGMRQVGTSSVTLRIDLGGGFAIAYKPRTDGHPQGYLAEIAAYRIARALGMDNVPPVAGRRIQRRIMERAFLGVDEADWQPIRDVIRWDDRAFARGAAIYWIPNMRSSSLSTAAGVNAVAEWLTVGGEIGEGDDLLARDLSTLFTFDYLIANWDRLSGGNVSASDDRDRLFVRDHNVAFSVPFEGARYRRTRANLERVQRFSRALVQRVASLDESTLRAVLQTAPESDVRPVLTDAQIAGVVMRARAIISYVAAQIALHGSDAVLFWP